MFGALSGTTRKTADLNGSRPQRTNNGFKRIPPVADKQRIYAGRDEARFVERVDGYVSKYNANKIETHTHTHTDSAA